MALGMVDGGLSGSGWMTLQMLDEMRVGDGRIVKLFDGITELIVELDHLLQCPLEAMIFLGQLHVPLPHFLVLALGGQIVFEPP